MAPRRPATRARRLSCTLRVSKILFRSGTSTRPARARAWGARPRARAQGAKPEGPEHEPAPHALPDAHQPLRLEHEEEGHEQAEGAELQGKEVVLRATAELEAAHQAVDGVREQRDERGAQDG